MATAGNVVQQMDADNQAHWAAMLDQINNAMDEGQLWDDCYRLASIVVLTLGIPLRDTDPALQGFLQKYAHVTDPVMTMGNVFFKIKEVLSRADLNAQGKCIRIKVYIKVLVMKCRLPELPWGNYYTQQDCTSHAVSLANRMAELLGRTPPLYFCEREDEELLPNAPPPRPETPREEPTRNPGSFQPFTGTGFQLGNEERPASAAAAAASPEMKQPAEPKPAEPKPAEKKAVEKKDVEKKDVEKKPSEKKLSEMKIMTVEDFDNDPIVQQLVMDCEKHELREMIQQRVERATLAELREFVVKLNINP